MPGEPQVIGRCSCGQHESTLVRRYRKGTPAGTRVVWWFRSRRPRGPTWRKTRLPACIYCGDLLRRDGTTGSPSETAAMVERARLTGDPRGAIREATVGRTEASHAE